MLSGVVGVERKILNRFDVGRAGATMCVTLGKNHVPPLQIPSLFCDIDALV